VTVTLHLPANPADRSVMVRRVRTLAGDPAQVRSGNGGLVVSDALALAYLATGQPAASDGQISRRPSAELAQVVRGAEERAGLVDITEAPAPDPAPQPRTAVARRPRRQVQQGAAT